MLPPGENKTAQLRGSVQMVGVSSGENLTAQMRGLVRIMGVSPAETDI